MKVVQICLTGSYNPDLGYQDNILPHYYTKIGLDCVTITSQYYNTPEGVVRNTRRRTVLPENTIIRLPNFMGLPNKFIMKFRLFSGLYRALEEEAPDYIFLHGCQLLSAGRIIRYCKKHPSVRLYADSHADYVNSASNWLSMRLLHKCIWRKTLQKLTPYVLKFWGVTPLRCEFLGSVYKVPREKIDLLVLGADSDHIDIPHKEEIRARIRAELSLSSDDFLVITGGKIDRMKNIHLLAEAFGGMENDSIKLLIFGSIGDDMPDLARMIAQNSNIVSVGWLQSDAVYDYFLASDLGVFPGTHSVLWEQAVGTGLPCIFKHWPGMEHVDVGGNCVLLDEITPEIIKQNILDLYNRDGYEKMLSVAQKTGVETFSYEDIARRSLCLNTRTRQAQNQFAKGKEEDTVKIAYLMLAHTDPSLLARACKVLKSTGEIFIHIDKKADEKPFIDTLKSNNVPVTFVKNRYKVYWAGFNSVSATVELLRAALSSDPDLNRFILLQNLDYPFWSDRDILSFFDSNRDVEFIRACNISQTDDVYFTGKYSSLHFYDFSRGKRYLRFFLHHILAKAIGIVHKRPNTVELYGRKCDLYYGSALFAVTREMAELFVSVYDTEKKFNAFLKHVSSPDESYFQTIAHNSDFSKKTAFHGPEPLKRLLVNWRNLHLFTYDNQIAVYTMDDYDYICQENSMFIRKVRSGISDTLLDTIDAKRMPEETGTFPD